MFFDIRNILGKKKQKNGGFSDSETWSSAYFVNDDQSDDVILRGQTGDSLEVKLHTYGTKLDILK